MASKALQARLQAQAAKVAGSSGDDGEVAGGLSDTEAEIETPDVAAAVDVASEAAPSAAGDDASAAASTPAEPETPEQIEAKARTKRLELFEEKLKNARERRHAARLEARAKADRQAAKAERDAAAEEKAAAAKERAELAEGRRDYKKFFAANGMDPRQAYEDMTRQALEAGTPEAQLKRMQEDFHTELAKFREAEVAPLKKQLEEERAARAELAKQSEEQRVVTNFSSALGDPAFRDLRIEYPDEALLGYVRNMIDNPRMMYETARIRGVALTDPQKGFTMHEILKVLAAEQAAHDQGKQARRAAQAPAEAQVGQPATVNGTAPRRNAGTAIGNDLASQRASTKAEVPGLSPRERLRQRQQAEIRRSGG